MDIQEQINNYLAELTDRKGADMKLLHQQLRNILPKSKLWFFSGKDETGKIVSNPNIGYGQLTLKNAAGKTQDFYQIGISANTTGISVYLMGLKDKKYLRENFADKIGKANITGYCIKFKALNDIHLNILLDAIAESIKLSS